MCTRTLLQREIVQVYNCGTTPAGRILPYMIGIRIACVQTGTLYTLYTSAYVYVRYEYMYNTVFVCPAFILCVH